MTITTKLGHTYQRAAWTGGDVPDADFECYSLSRDLIQAFYDEQVAESGGLDLWVCTGTSVEERKAIFKKRALLDAWRTMRG